MDSFPTQLRRHRVAAGLTQEALAERAGLSVRGIQNLERGERRPYADTTARLIAALHLEGTACEEFKSASRAQPRRDAQSTPRTTPNETRAETNLPTPLTACLGRDAERADLSHKIESSRLVTLLGPGGAGKTRLAIQLGHDLLEHGSVWLVELDSVSDPQLVPHAVAAALGLSPDRDEPPLTQLCAALRERHLVLILDNCEHVLTACAALAEALLGRCPDVRIVSTSRQPLGLPCELVHPVRPLETPPLGADDAALQGYASVQLFLERAARAAPDQELGPEAVRITADICRRLDGVPLALELAAARVRGLGLDELSARLDRSLEVLSTAGRGRPRQQSVRATLDWSVTLLDAEQQALLRRLSVFSGGWTLPACEAIGESASTEALLQLVDHSLVQVDRRTPGRTRYRLLETVRQYAAERLMRAGETHATRALHLRYYVDVAEQVERGLDGSGQVDSLAIFDLEAANLRAALDFALEQADAESALRLLGALGDYWHLRGQSLAGLNLARAALELAPKSTPRTRARALRAAGRMAVCVRATTAQAWLEQSLTVCREHDDSGGAARAMLELGRMWIDAAVLDRAVAILEHGCQLAEAAGDVHASGALLVALGQAHLDRADYATSLPLLERGRALLRELGDRLGEANALQHIAMARLELCDIAEAESALDAAHALLSELGDASGVAWIEHDLGRVALDNHELDRAAACFERSLRQFRLLGHGNGIAWTLHNLGRTHMLGGDLDLAEGCLVEGLEQFVRLDHARGEGWAHANLAWLQARRGRTDAAWARLAQALSKFRSQKYGVGLSLCAVVAAQLVLGDCPRQAARWLGLSEQLGYGGLYDRERASQVAGALRERLDEKDFAREWMGGGSLTGAALRAELKRLSARAAREPSLATG